MANSVKRKQHTISSFFTPAAKKALQRPIEAEPTLVLSHFSANQEPETKKARPTPKPANLAQPRNDRAPKATKSSKKLTPLELQFISLKLEHTDKVLAIQVGYKFKFFGEDAVVASHLLNIMLIPGNLKLDERTHDRFAYCSIPDNRLHIHLQRLLNHGLKVGVVKQTETAAIKNVESKSGLFERTMTGVYTKATYMGDELLTGDSSSKSSTDDTPDGMSYIVCIDEGRETALVAVLPLTGDVVYDEFKDTLSRDELDTRLAFLSFSEVLISLKEKNAGLQKNISLKNANATVTHRKQLTDQQVMTSLQNFSKEVYQQYSLFSLSIQRCVAELIDYLAEFKLSSVFSIPANFSKMLGQHFMLLPANTLRALDIFQVEENRSVKGTLLWVLDHTLTKPGYRHLRKWICRPLIDKERIQERSQAVLVLHNGDFVHLLDAFKQALIRVGKSGVDLDKLLIKVHYAATNTFEKVSRKDLYLMLKTFNDVLNIFRTFGKTGIDDFKKKHRSLLLNRILEDMLEYSQNLEIENFIDSINGAAAMDELDLQEQKVSFFTKGNLYEVIAKEQENVAAVESELEEELEAIKKFLKRPQLTYITNLKETHLIEVRNGKAVDALPSDWLKISGTKTVSRFRTPNVDKLHKRLQYHNEMLLKVCDQCFHDFTKMIDGQYALFHSVVGHLATFDCLLSLAAAATSIGQVSFVKPEIVDEQLIEVKDSSHPILHRLHDTHVPNNVDLSYKKRVLIITGPNMGGKLSYVKQVALLVIVTQIGGFLPCSLARMGIFDSIYIRMGASDNILQGQSTFMVEMLESKQIIENFTLRLLIILDEIGRGTGTSDGIALAYAILNYIIEDSKQPLTLFITHYPSLHVLNRHSAVHNHHMAFMEVESESETEKDVIFLYKLVDGVVSNSYGLNVARMVGIDPEIISKAREKADTMRCEVERDDILHALNEMSVLSNAELLRRFK